MVSRSTLRVASLTASALAAASAFGVVATTTYGADPSSNPDVGYIMGFGGSAVAVGPNVVLTAGHVVPGGSSGQTFVFNGTSYTVTSSVAAPDILVTDPTSPQYGQMTHVDLTLAYVSGTFSNYATVGTSYTMGGAISMVGYGQTGGVDANGLQYDVNYTSGQQLSGTNTIDYAMDNYVPTTSTGGNGGAGGPVFLSFLSQAGDAALGGGDSGGAWFQGNTLVGISDFTFKLDGYQSLPDYGFASANTIDGSSYFGSGAIDVTDPRLNGFFASIRTQPTPEPSALAALGLGAAAVLRRRRRRA